MKSRDSMKPAEILETIAISVTVLSLLPVVYWLNNKELSAHLPYFYYLFFMLCLMGYIAYRRIKKLKVAFKSSRNKGQDPRV